MVDNTTPLSLPSESRELVMFGLCSLCEKLTDEIKQHRARAEFYDMTKEADPELASSIAEMARLERQTATLAERIVKHLSAAAVPVLAGQVATPSGRDLKAAARLYERYLSLLRDTSDRCEANSALLDTKAALRSTAPMGSA